MPKIMELKIIDGDLWARLGKPSDFPSGVALWTPDEQKRMKEQAATHAVKEYELALETGVDV